MKTQKLSQNVSVKNTEHNRGIKKFYDIYCLKSYQLQLNALEITENLNSHPLSRLDCFESLSQTIIPDFYNYFHTDKDIHLEIFIDRCFFFPFNMSSFYRDYSLNLRFLKDKYPFLQDDIPDCKVDIDSNGTIPKFHSFSYSNSKIPVCLIDVYRNESLIFRYVFFVKEVCNV